MNSDLICFIVPTDVAFKNVSKSLSLTILARVWLSAEANFQYFQNYSVVLFDNYFFFMRNRFDLTQLLISKIAKGKECVSGLEQPRFRLHRLI